MALFLGDDNILTCTCGNTVFVERKECRIKIIKEKKFSERVKTSFVCTKCKKVVYEKLNDFDD